MGRHPDLSRAGTGAVAALFLIVGVVVLALQPAAGDDETAAKGTDEISPFTGTARCATCHIEEHKAWATSSHARSMEPANADNMALALGCDVVEHPPGKTRFRKEGDSIFAETVGPDGKPATYPLTYVVGRMRIRMLVTEMESTLR